MIHNFRAKDAAEKMRKAASTHDYEAAIVHREEWKKWEAEIVEIDLKAVAQEIDRKVIDIFSKQPVPDTSDYTVIDLVTAEDAVESPVGEAEKFEPSPEEVSLLKFITEEVNEGRLTGLVVFAGHREDDGCFACVSSWPSTTVLDNIQPFLGAFEEAKFDLLNVLDDEYEDDQEQEEHP